MKKNSFIFNLFKNYKIETFQYLCIDLFLKFVNIASSFLLMIFIDTINVGNNFIVIFVILYISILTFSCISTLFKSITLSFLKDKVLFDFREIALSRFLNSKYEYSSNLNRGSYLSQRIINDIELLNNLFVEPTFKSISSLFFLICLLPIFLHFNSSVVVLIIISTIIPSLFFSFFNKKNQHFTSLYQEKFALSSSNLSDVIDAVKEIKLFDMYDKEMHRIKSNVKDLVLVNIKKIFWGFASGQFSVTLQHIIIGILLGFLGYQVQNKIITLGQAIFVYTISDNLFFVINDFWGLYFSIKNSDVPWKRIKEVLIREDENDGLKNTITGIVNIVFKNVFVEKNNKIILSNLNFEIFQHDKVALIGPTGAGKTTVLNLIALFDRHSSGNVLVNNVDLYSINVKYFRSKISYFTQDTFLFNKTIRDNIILNLDYNDILVKNKYHEILKICQIEHLDDNKIVGNKGSFVSGGEKQRIALARCLMKDFDLLLLDEFGSAVHAKMELEIYNNLLAFYYDKIIIAVSHRLNVANLFIKKIKL